MWFTSLMQDTVSVLTTDNAGIPVYSFREEKGKLQYLSALPDEITGLQQDQSGYSKQEGLFLSALESRYSVPTHRYKDNLTGQHVWTIDRQDTETEFFAFKENSRYSSALKGRYSVPTRHHKDNLTPRNLWTIDQRETETKLFVFKENSRYSYEGKDFRVYPNRDSADGLIPIYQAFNLRTNSIEWSDTRKDFSKDYQDVLIAWYAEPFPIDASHF